MRFPSVFVSHGAPSLAVEDHPAHRFLQGFGADLGQPAAILVVSAHWDTTAPAVTTAPRLETIYDFSGFDPALYRLRYEPPGAVEVAEQVQGLLENAGFSVAADPQRGLDHGGWVPLLLMYPSASIPVLQLSVQSRREAGHHFRVGQALQPLRDAGVLIVGSGSLTHNLREAFHALPGAPTPPWVTQFSEWVAQRLAAQRIDDLLDYQQLAPHARRNHPTVEHFVPLLVALGASTPGVAPRRAHASAMLSVLAMDTYVFD